jgi:hypothetical protein
MRGSRPAPIVIPVLSLFVANDQPVAPVLTGVKGCEPIHILAMAQNALSDRLTLLLFEGLAPLHRPLDVPDSKGLPPQHRLQLLHRPDQGQI